MSLTNYALVATDESLEVEQIQAKVLELLKLEITDLEDYCDDSIPDNYPRFHLNRGGREIGTISTWGNKYCTRMKIDMGGYPSLYEAATCWVNPLRLKQLEELAGFVLRHKRSTMPDYF